MKKILSLFSLATVVAAIVDPSLISFIFDFANANPGELIFGISMVPSIVQGAERAAVKSAIKTKQADTAKQAIALVKSAPEVKDFNISIENEQGTAQLAVLWNASTLVTGLSAGTVTITNENGATYTNFLNLLKNGEFTSHGFWVTVEDRSQFNNAFSVYEADGVGYQSQNSRTADITKVTNIQAVQNQLSYYIPFPQKFTQYFAWTWSINASSLVQMTIGVVPGTQITY